jgi:predicted DNA-binding ribbon-helix-helix protein
VTKNGTGQGNLSAPVLKRTVNIAGHSTSVSLEQPFWDELVRIAGEKNKPIAELIEDIDTARQTNLSSALRLYVLYNLKSK